MTEALDPELARLAAEVNEWVGWCRRAVWGALGIGAMWLVQLVHHVWKGDLTTSYTRAEWALLATLGVNFLVGGVAVLCAFRARRRFDEAALLRHR